MLAKLSLCRTHALGGRKFQCGDCDEFKSLYNSCGDRHCPQCSGSKRVDFNDKASKLILPGVVYYQVVFILPAELSELALVLPPKETSGAQQVVNYLTRYLTGGPISEYRIVAATRDEVTFMAREGKRVGGERQQVPITLTTKAFVQRWCLHVQPDQLTKTRYFGGWSNNRQGDYVARCRELLESLGRGASANVLQASEETPREEPDLTCEHCRSDRMELLSQTPKPSWKDLLW